jgi:hypothetical protein
MMNIAVTKELKCFEGYLVVPALCLHLVVGGTLNRPCSCPVNS